MNCLKRALLLVALMTLAVFPLTTALAQETGGWEKGGAYDRLYKAAELDRIKGEIIEIRDVVPMKGMAPGIGLVVKDQDNEKITVHLGPKSFLGDTTGLKRGDDVKIRGAWAEIEGQDVFMAAKIKKGDFFNLKVRLTKDGTPFWSLSQEELEKERATD